MGPNSFRTIRPYMWAATFFSLVAGATTYLFLSPASAHETTTKCSKENAYCLISKLSIGEEAAKTLPSIQVTPPRIEPETGGQPATPARPISRTVTYVVETRGAISASVAEFKAQANQTLNSAQGWARLGVKFQQVTTGGDFTLVLSEASQVPSFSSGCDSTYSCNVGRYVIINQDRWLGATPSWNAASGSLRDYRHMVVNHETGHWLGHGHSMCGGAGQAAAVMQQQSINLQGCTFNPWPLASEIHSPRLGI